MNNAQFLRAGIVLLALPVFLAACSSNAGTAAQAEPVTETTTAATTAPALPSPPPADGGSFEDVEALQEAYMLAGGSCLSGTCQELYGAIVTGYAIECDEDTLIHAWPPIRVSELIGSKSSNSMSNGTSKPLPSTSTGSTG